MSRPVEATIDLRALRHNLSVAQKQSGNAKVFAVVKADAYGHGLDRVLPALVAADGFAVVEFDAAMCIRAGGIKKPILLLEGFFSSDELLRIAQQDCTAVVHEAGQVAALNSAQLQKPIDVFVKVNSGMNRLGFLPEEAAKVCRALKDSRNVRDILLMTHFADADGVRGVDWQLERVLPLASSLSLNMCVANSAALLRYPQTHGAWVRPGIMLYGASPFADTTAEELDIRPVMTLRSQIIAVQSLAKGDCVGYGCTYEATQATRIGVVAAGYGDGYPRHAPDGTPVLVCGVRTETVGRVSMDTLIVDIDALPDATIGSPVTLWGQGLPVEEVAESAGTVSYELLTGVTKRVQVSVLD